MFGSHGQGRSHRRISPAPPSPTSCWSRRASASRTATHTLVRKMRCLVRKMRSLILASRTRNEMGQPRELGRRTCRVARSVARKFVCTRSGGFRVRAPTERSACDHRSINRRIASHRIGSLRAAVPAQMPFRCAQTTYLQPCSGVRPALRRGAEHIAYLDLPRRVHGALISARSPPHAVAMRPGTAAMDARGGAAYYASPCGAANYAAVGQCRL